jgi:hypothetical protein
MQMSSDSRSSVRALPVGLIVFATILCASWLYAFITSGSPSCNVYCGGGGLSGYAAVFISLVVSWIVLLVLVIVAFATKRSRVIAAFCCFALAIPVTAVITSLSGGI